MSKPIILTPQDWEKLKQQLFRDYHSSVVLIREKMKVVLGFTARNHREWISDPGYDGYGKYENTVRLDFYDEPKRLMFLLKYTEYLSHEKEKTVN